MLKSTQKHEKTRFQNCIPDTVASSGHTVVSSLTGEFDTVVSSRHTVVSSLTGDSDTVVSSRHTVMSPNQYSKMHFYVFAHKILFSNPISVLLSPMHS